MKIYLIMILIFGFLGCEDSDSNNTNNNSTSDCNELIMVDSSRGDCSETLNIANEVSITTSGDLPKNNCE